MASDTPASKMSKPKEKRKRVEKMTGEPETEEELLERSVEEIRSKMKEKRRKKVQADLSLSRSRHKNAYLVLKASLRQNNRTLAKSLEMARTESRQAQQAYVELQRERHLLQTVVNRYQEQHTKQRDQIMGVRELLNKVTSSLLDTVGLLGEALDMCVMPRQSKDSSLGLVFRNSSVNSDDLSDMEKKEIRRPGTPPKVSAKLEEQTSASAVPSRSPELTEDSAFPSKPEVPDLPDIDIPLMFMSEDTSLQDKAHSRRDTRQKSLGNASHKNSRRTSSLLDPAVIAATAAEVAKSVDMIKTVVEESRVADSDDEGRESCAGDGGEKTIADVELDPVINANVTDNTRPGKASKKRSGKHSRQKGKSGKDRVSVRAEEAEKELLVVEDSDDGDIREENKKKRRHHLSREQGTDSKLNSVEVLGNESEQEMMDGDNKEMKGKLSDTEKKSERTGKLDCKDDHDVLPVRDDGERSKPHEETPDGDTGHSDTRLEENEKAQHLENSDKVGEKSDYRLADMEMTNAGHGHISVLEVSHQKSSGSDKKDSSRPCGSGNSNHNSGLSIEKSKDVSKKSKLPVMKKDKSHKTKSSKLQRVGSKAQSKAGSKKNKERMEDKDVSQMTVFDLSMGDSFTHPTPPCFGKSRSKMQLPSEDVCGDKIDDVEANVGEECHILDSNKKEPKPSENKVVVSSSDEDASSLPVDKPCKIKRKSRKSKTVVTPGAPDDKVQLSKKALLEELNNLDASYLADVTNHERRSKIESALPSRKSSNKGERESLNDLITKPLAHKSSKRKLSKRQFFLGQDVLENEQTMSKPEKKPDKRISGNKSSAVNPDLDGLNAAKTISVDLNTTHDILGDLNDILVEVDKPVKAKNIQRRTTILKSKQRTKEHLDLNVTFDLDDHQDERTDKSIPEKLNDVPATIKHMKPDRRTFCVEKRSKNTAKSLESQSVASGYSDSHKDAIKGSFGNENAVAQGLGIDKKSHKEENKQLETSDIFRESNDARCKKKEQNEATKTMKEKRRNSKKRSVNEGESMEGQQPNKVAKRDHDVNVKRSEPVSIQEPQGPLKELTNGLSGQARAQSNLTRVSLEREDVDGLEDVKSGQVKAEDAEEKPGQMEVPQRRARRNKVVSYKEPSLHSKLRQGDPNTETIYKENASKKSRKSDQRRSALNNITNQTNDRKTQDSDDVAGRKPRRISAESSNVVDEHTVLEQAL